MIRIVYLVVLGVLGVTAIASKTYNFACRTLKNWAT